MLVGRVVRFVVQGLELSIWVRCASGPANAFGPSRCGISDFFVRSVLTTRLATTWTLSESYVSHRGSFLRDFDVIFHSFPLD